MTQPQRETLEVIKALIIIDEVRESHMIVVLTMGDNQFTVLPDGHIHAVDNR